MDILWNGSFACEEGILTLTWFIIAAVLITGICIYVTVKHGMRATKFLAKLTMLRKKRKREALKEN